MTNEVTRTAPPHIWLNVSDEASDNAQPFPATHEGVTWCHHAGGVACEVEYVRADLAQSAPPAKDEPPSRKDLLFSTVKQQERHDEMADRIVMRLKQVKPVHIAGSMEGEA